MLERHKFHSLNLITKARKHIANRDRVLLGIIRARGFQRIPILKATYFGGLTRSIVYQQLAPKAASCVWNRVRYAVSRNGHPTPKNIVDRRPDELRALGLSTSKAKFIWGLAVEWINGRFKSQAWHRMTNAEIRDLLMGVNGVGPWTADMFLIFSLGRTDVMPLQDYGLQRAIKLAYGIKHLPRERDLIEFARKWHPFESFACWQLWKYLDSQIT